MFHRLGLLLFMLLSGLLLMAQLPSHYFEKAEVFRQNSQRDSAAHYYSTAGDAFIDSNNTQRAAEAYNQAGAMFNRLDEYEQAGVYLEKAYSLGHCGAADSLTFATTNVNLGVMYSALENYEVSLQHHFRALHIRLALLDTIHRDVATSYGNIGNVYYNFEKYDSALYHHEMAFRIRKWMYGEQSPELIPSCIGIGNACRELGDFPGAENSFQAALSLKERQLESKDHPDLAKYYDLLAEVNDLMGHASSAASFRAEAARLRNN
jgi:tetratricopeptide (TPR) repeat protein